MLFVSNWCSVFESLAKAASRAPCVRKSSAEFSVFLGASFSFCSSFVRCCKVASCIWYKQNAGESVWLTQVIQEIHAARLRKRKVSDTWAWIYYMDFNCNMMNLTCFSAILNTISAVNFGKTRIKLHLRKWLNETRKAWTVTGYQGESLNYYTSICLPSLTAICLKGRLSRNVELRSRQLNC